MWTSRIKRATRSNCVDVDQGVCAGPSEVHSEFFGLIGVDIKEGRVEIYSFSRINRTPIITVQ